MRTVSASSLATAADPGVRCRPSRLVSLHRSEREGGWSRLNEFTFALYEYRHAFAWLDWRALRMSWRFARSDSDMEMGCTHGLVYKTIGVAHVYSHHEQSIVHQFGVSYSSRQCGQRTRCHGLHASQHAKMASLFLCLPSILKDRTKQIIQSVGASQSHPDS